MGVDKAADAHSGAAKEHFPLRKQESLEKRAFEKDTEGWENFCWTEIRDGGRTEQWSRTGNMRSLEAVCWTLVYESGRETRWIELKMLTWSQVQTSE